MKFALTIILALCSTNIDGTVHTTQDGIHVNATLEPTSFTVGDTVRLRIEAVAQDGVQLSLRHHDDFGSFIVTDVSTLLDVPIPEGRQWVWSMQLDTFDASVTAIQDIAIDWTGAEGNSGMISIEPIPVTVTSIAGNALQEMELRDIKSTVPLFSKIGWWPAVAISGIALVLIALAVRFFFPRQKSLLSSHEKAMQALQSLQGSDHDVQTFYTTLSTIVRTYIEERFQISAHGKTTREFLIAEKENPRLEHCDRKALADFLVAADLVKFARYAPKATMWNEAIHSAKQFVSNTIPSTEPTRSEVAA